MAVYATLISSEHIFKIRTTEDYKVFTYSFPSVGISATSSEIVFTTPPEEDVALPNEGIISSIRVACASTDYDFSLRETPSLVLPHVDEFYNSTGNNGSIVTSNLGLIWTNEETIEVNKFYGILKNNDGSNATGLITFKFIMKAFSLS